MANYKRLFVYKRSSNLAQAQYLAVDLTIVYETQTFLTVDLQILYNILGIDARSLWEPKVSGQALWQELDKSDPTGTIFSTPIESDGDASDSLQLESGEAFDLQSGDDLELE